MSWGRAYFAVQAAAGAAWWLAVFASPFVRDATLGGIDPVLMALFDVPLFVGASTIAALGDRGSRPTAFAAAFVATAWTLLVTACLGVYATVTTLAGWGVLAMAAASAGSVLALCLVSFGRVPTEWLLVGPFAFRRADPQAPTRSHVTATGVQIVLFWGFFLGVIPLVLSFFERRWRLDVPFPSILVALGAVVFVLASALGFWSAATMSTKGVGTPLPSAMANRLVIAGPYRFVRNPMAVSGIVQGAAVGLMLSSWVVVAYAVCGSLVWNWAIRPHEEADLEARFGEAFVRYRGAVRCWVPQVRNASDDAVRGFHAAPESD